MKLSIGSEIKIYLVINAMANSKKSRICGAFLSFPQRQLTQGV